MILGVGVDVLSVARVARRLEEDPGWPQVLLGPRELAAASGVGGQAAAVAGRFAAKEATLKVLAVGPGDGVLFREVELLGEPARPVVELSGRALAAGGRAGVRCVHVRVAEAEGKVMAVAVAEGEMEGRE